MPISRTVGADQVVDEMLFCFTHDSEIDWMLPGVRADRQVRRDAAGRHHQFRGDKLQTAVALMFGPMNPARIKELAMAGHSKWKQIKRKKAVTDSRRASAWTKIIREITVAARAAEAIRAATPGSAWPGSTRARRSTCPRKTSSAPSRRAPASSRASATRS